MKTFIVLFSALFSLSLFAFDCKQTEAQFIGTVTEYKKEAVDQYIFDCSYAIEFSRFDSNMLCPLDESEVYSVRFEDTNCSLKNGDFISGYLVKNLKTEKIEIE
jgi:hypothetical protein